MEGPFYTSIYFFGGLILGGCLGVVATFCLLFLAEVITDEQKAALGKAWHWLTRANPRAGSDDVGTAEWVEGKR